MRITVSTDDPEPSLRKQLTSAKKCKNNLSLNLLFWLILGTITSTLSNAATSSNIGLTSNYLWRGVTQSNTNFAEYGGLDYSNQNGFFLGSWVSTLNGGSYELDLYGGFAKTINDFNYTIGYISYQYPNDNDYFNETYVNLSYGIIKASIAYTISSKDNNSVEFSQGDLYYSVGASKTLDNGIGISFLVGQYNFDDPNGDDYNHLNFNVSKKNFTFAIDKTNSLITNNDLVASIAWSKSFNL